MASRRSVDSRIDSLVKVASAKIPLVLATATIFVVSGCGGDSDSDTPAAETAPTSAAIAEERPGGREGGQGAGASSPNGGDAQGDRPRSSSRASADKEGPSVPIPQGAPEPGITPQQRQEATVASISLSSPAVKPSASGSPSALASTYTCDGENTWPELRWEGLPAGTQELALFVMGLEQVDGELFFDWAVAGLSPDLSGIEAGRLPKGAVMGRNSFGKVDYSICPATGESETYFFTLYALTRQLNLGRGFDPHELRKQALEASSDGGLMAASYGR